MKKSDLSVWLIKKRLWILSLFKKTWMMLLEELFRLSLKHHRLTLCWITDLEALEKLPEKHPCWNPIQHSCRNTRSRNTMHHVCFAESFPSFFKATSYGIQPQMLSWETSCSLGVATKAYWRVFYFFHDSCFLWHLENLVRKIIPGKKCLDFLPPRQ